MAKIIETSSDRLEKKRLTSGHVKCLGFYLGGDVDFETGTVKSVVIPTLTQAFQDALKESTLEERAEALKRLLDSNNAYRPQEMLALANDRDMENHDMLLVKSIVTGRFSPVPLVKLNQKSSQATFAHWLKMSTDKTRRTQDELNRAEARACLLLDNDSTREDLIAPDPLTSLSVVNGGIANFAGDSDAMFVSTNAAKRPIVTQAALHLYGKLKDSDVRRWIETLSQEKVLDLSYHCVARLDQLMSKIAKASNDYDANTAIAGNLVGNITLDAYKKAVKCFADDCDYIVKAANGGPEFRPSISIRPIVVPLPQPKRQKQNEGTGYVPRGPNDRGNGQGNNGNGREGNGRDNGRRGGSWDGGWGNNRAPYQRDPEAGRDKGILFARGNFTNFMPAELAREHCSDFHVQGKVCTGACLKKHVPPRTWTRYEKEQLIQHVESNKDHMRFLAPFARFLVGAKKDLLKLGEQG